MSLMKAVKKGLSRGFQPLRWVGIENIKSNGKVCVDMVSDLLSSEQHEQTLQREKQKQLLLGQQLTGRELHSRKQLALGLVLLYLLGSLGLVGYAIYLIAVKAMVLPAIMSLIMAFLVLTYSLRELMVYGQIRAKRSRITLLDLFRYLVKGFPA